MARAALPRRLTWQLATVLELVDETPRCKSISFEVPDWLGHRAGQHLDVRLTAEDGYQAQRSYSIASGPEDTNLVLTVERLEDGEVSPYLVDELRPGDQIELRGPVGGYFVWEESLGGPLVLVAGGSGIVPLRAILRHWAAGARDTSVSLLYSSRSLTDVIYRQELSRLDGGNVRVCLALTREWPPNWIGHRGRIDQRLLAEVIPEPAQRPFVYVCGPTSFVENVAQALVEIGNEPARIKTERFGPTGA
ncbi:MAG: ferredoxin reductase [Solirubrobacterales bacterium]|nr:ferredoxin reductase [Solirubrobacterales bacterium]